MEYTSCNWIAHGLNFEPGHVEMCCLRCHVGGGNVIVQNPYRGEPIDWEEFFKLKEKFINENKEGKIDPRCEGCFNLEKKSWDDQNKYFSYIHFNHWTHCNSKCRYCFTDYNKEFFNTYQHYSVLPVIKDMFEKNLFRPGGEITFAGGEPTILTEFEELLNFILDNTHDVSMRIHTSVIKYSPAIARGVKEGRIYVVVSLDSGTRQVFKDIKGVDAFDKVVETTRRYAEMQTGNRHDLVSTKFIFFPEYNDSIEEVEKWLQVTQKTGTKAVILDLEHEWFKAQREKDAMPEVIWQQFDYARRRAAELGFVVDLYNSARYLSENPQDFPNKDFMPNPRGKV